MKITAFNFDAISAAFKRNTYVARTTFSSPITNVLVIMNTILGDIFQISEARGVQKTKRPTVF